MNTKRSKLLPPVVVMMLTIGAIAGVWGLVGVSNASQRAQLRINAQMLSLSDLQKLPFEADRHTGGSPSATRAKIDAAEGSIARGLTQTFEPGVRAGLLAQGRSDLVALAPVVTGIYDIASSPGGLPASGFKLPPFQAQLIVRSGALSRVLHQVSDIDAARAARAGTQTKLGAAAVMLLLLAAFVYFYFRSVAARDAVERLLAEKEGLLGVSRREARTDALTGLGNRRALASDLAAAIAPGPDGDELLLVMFDLDGFKPYNDTFGHAAGDALLQRLGARLAAVAAEQSGLTYRMGGDEFCLLARCAAADAEGVLDGTLAALRDSGEGWQVGCSQGAVWIPSEADTESRALKLADERMYAHKASRAAASRQVSDALLQVISEQDRRLNVHVERVSELAGALAQALGQPDHEVRRITLAARLHDVGKTAIPAAILSKPGALDGPEWEFIRAHPVIGARIVQAAPALAETADLIRASHERIDGHGYPNGLAGESIPLGARIIFVCDAYDAMISGRPYRQPLTVEAALQELQTNAGIQFDAAIVHAFCEQINTPSEPEAAPLVRSNS